LGSWTKSQSQVLNHQKFKELENSIAKGILKQIPKEILILKPKAKIFKNVRNETSKNPRKTPEYETKGNA
jgi:hypothetical protein